MITLRAGELIAIFVAIIGCYVFTFTTTKTVSNHIHSKLDEFRLEVVDRLARIETALRIEKKK